MLVQNEGAVAGKLFRPDLLALRRRMLGMSQGDLAKEAGVSQGTLSKIEQGLKEISEEQVLTFASALNCGSSFFFQAEREYGPPLSAHPLFRKKAAVGVKVLDRVVAELNVRLAHIRQFLKSVDFEPELPLPQYSPEDFEGGAAEIAKNVRRAWYMPRGPVRSLTEYAERAGCLIVPCDLSEAQIDGVSYQVPGLPPVVFLNKMRPADRQRFTLAHEIGHLVMHRFPEPDMEQQANDFASELLMPAEDIRFELKALSLEKAAQLKPYWRVSMAALIVRAETIGAIDSHQALRLWKQMSAKLYRTREPVQLDFEVEQVSLFPALLKNLVEDMEYSPSDLEASLHLSYAELGSLYGPDHFSTKSPSLRLVG